jgi:hypothetical protein
MVIAATGKIRSAFAVWKTGPPCLLLVTGDRLDTKHYFQHKFGLDDHAATVQPMATKSNILSEVSAQRIFPPQAIGPIKMPATSTQNQDEERNTSWLQNNRIS